MVFVQCNGYFIDGQRCTEQIATQVFNVIQACKKCDERIRAAARRQLCKADKDALKKLSFKDRGDLVNQKMFVLHQVFSPVVGVVNRYTQTFEYFAHGGFSAANSPCYTRLQHTMIGWLFSLYFHLYMF